MANSNFVVHNGLTVGPLTIDAATGNISTTGVIAVTGAGSFGGLNAYQIYSGSSNVTATTSYVNVSVNGSNVAAFSSQSLSITGFFNTAGNILAGGATVSAANVNGSLTASGITQVTNATNATGGVSGALQVTGGAYIAQDLWVVGNIYAGNLMSTVANIVTIQDGLIYLDRANTYPYNYSIGMYSHYIGGPANAYVHSAVTRQPNDSAWWFVSNIAEPSPATGNINVYDSNAIYDTIRVGNVIPGISNLATLGSTTNWFSKAFTVSATAQYADLAENYVGDASYEAGTVVCFGGDKEVTLCDVDMCSRVAGVVSTNPAYLMNGTQTGENIVPVALTGRVPTKVRGPISKGDLIVSAGDGHARAEGIPQVGTVIGKALEDFDGDSGVIEVVVGKH